MPYAVVWGLSFGFVAGALGLARLVRSGRGALVAAAVIATGIVVVEAATDARQGGS